LLLVLLPTSTLALAAEPAGMTPHQVARIRQVTTAVIAPDGSRTAYLLSVPRKPLVDEDGPSWVELHVAGSDGKSTPYVTGEVNVSEVAWTPDGKSITFLAKRGKDEHKSLYAISSEGGEARRLLTFGSDITAYSILPDGKRVAFLATEPEPKAKADARKKGFSQVVFEEDAPLVRPWLAALDGTSAPRAIKLVGSASELHASPTSDALAMALAPTSSVDDNFTRRKVTVTLTAPSLVQFDNPGKLGKIAWSPDGKFLAMISASDPHDPAAGRLLVAPSEGGELRDLLPGYDGHVADIAWAGRDKVVFLGDEGTGTVIGTVGLEGSAVTATPLGDLVATSFSLANDGRKLALVGQTSKHPNELFLTDLDHLTHRTRVTDSNPWLASVALAPQEVITYKARDGLELQGVLIRPLDVAAGARVPLVLDVHGGPESHVRNGWVTSYSMPGQVLAARGIAVFCPNYRGSTGRGVAFSKLGQGDPAGKEFDDLIDAVDHFVASGLADPAKVGVTGSSYGGYATAWCSTRYSDRFAAGVMFVGISDKISKTGTTDIPNEEFLVHARKRPWDDWTGLLERSPIFHADKARTPLLILHGKDDPRVFPGQSLELYRFLKVRGRAPVRLVLYPGEGHGNLRAASRLDYNLRMTAWLTHYLKGNGGTPPPAEISPEEPKH
jgi:dipeptidyl aminopeptidase/acylaminoacyl peptidase